MFCLSLKEKQPHFSNPMIKKMFFLTIHMNCEKRTLVLHMIRKILILYQKLIRTPITGQKSVSLSLFKFYLFRNQSLKKSTTVFQGLRGKKKGKNTPRSRLYFRLEIKYVNSERQKKQFYNSRKIAVPSRKFASKRSE